MPRFLKDEPTEKDDLWWTHNKITSTLKVIIDSLQSEKSIKNIIGLFWDWWSWKSSIIKQLDDRSIYNVFEFDSWSHKNEFLKRAFLIELTKNIKFDDKILGFIWYKYAKYTDINTIDFLSKKNIIKVLHVEPENSYNWLWFIEIILVFIVFLKILWIDIFKILIDWANPILKLKLFEWFENIYIQYIDIITFIFLVIIIISFIKWFYPFFKTKSGSNSKWLKWILDYVLLKKIDYNESLTSSENEDFSNYDFQEYFINLIGKYLEVDSNKKLIIVLDNLDRVNDDIVLNSISLIQTIIEWIKKNQQEDKEIYSRLFFVLPIDKIRLKEVFENLIKVKNDEKDKIKDNFTEWFIDKTFSVVFSIPRLEQSDWRIFFDKKLKEAFSEDEIGDTNLKDLIASFYSYTKKSWKNITPREIINFINELASNYFFWKEQENIDVITFEKQFYYIIFKRYLFYRFINFFDTNKDNIDEGLVDLDVIWSKLNYYLQEINFDNYCIVEQEYKTLDIANITNLHGLEIDFDLWRYEQAEHVINNVNHKSNLETLFQDLFELLLWDKSKTWKSVWNILYVIYKVDNEELNKYKENVLNYINKQFFDWSAKKYYKWFLSNIDDLSLNWFKMLMEDASIKHQLKELLPFWLIKEITLHHKKAENE